MGGNQVTVTNTFDGAITNTNTTTIFGSVTNALTNCVNSTSSAAAGTVTNADGSITVTITNLFCTNFTTNVVVRSATPGTDFQPSSGTLAFADYEMARDIPVDILGNTAATSNRLVQVILTKAVLDSNELFNGASDLAPPTIDPIGGSASMALLSLLIPGNQNPPCSIGTNVYNMEGSVFYLGEPNTNVILTLLLTVSRSNPSASATTVNYTVGGNPRPARLFRQQFCPATRLRLCHAQSAQSEYPRQPAAAIPARHRHHQFSSGRHRGHRGRPHNHHQHRGGEIQ